MSQIASLLGQDAARFIELIDDLKLSSRKVRYTFTSNEDFKHMCSNDLAKGANVFWGEMLARTHLTAVTAILRNRHWITALILAVQEDNLLAFASTFRGLIESVADSATALRSVPHTLARDRLQILRALSGKGGRPFFMVEQLEDELIHFSYGRRLKTAERANAPLSHSTRKIRDYIKILEQGKISGITECYSELCDITHPGASSVWMWLSPISDKELDLMAQQDTFIIMGFLKRYQRMFVELLMFGFNPAIVTLNVLNYFPLEQFHVPQLLTLNLSGIPLWQNCQKALEGIQPA